MNSLKLHTQKLKREGREFRILFGLVEHFIKTGKPVGSNTLKDAGFGNLSSATIRNYFSKLEEEGYLSQQHTSSGRIPTSKAFHVYAHEYIDQPVLDLKIVHQLQELGNTDTRELAAYLQHAGEVLSSLTGTAVFLSAPRFDQDYIVAIKLKPIDSHRCVCVILTDFGLIRTEVIQIEEKIHAFSAKRLEAYFHWRLTDRDKPEHFEPGEEDLAQRIYNELILRYVVSYSNFVDAELYRTGFSRLLNYPDFYDSSILASSLALFENSHYVRMLVRDCCSQDKLKIWVGEDLAAYMVGQPSCAIIAIPYYINQKIAGSVGILSPMRVPYKELFGTLQTFSQCISDAITRNLYKHKITFRQPQAGAIMIAQEERLLVDRSRRILIENKE